MKRLISIAIAVGLGMALCASPAGAAFDIENFDVTFTEAPPEGAESYELGSTAAQAGSHPHAMTTSFDIAATPIGEGGLLLEEPARDLLIAQISGFAGDPTAMPRCSSAEFLTRISIKEPEGGSIFVPDCPDSSAVGWVGVVFSNEIGSSPVYSAVYNLEPPPGTAAKLGFWSAGIPVPIDVTLTEEPPYRISAATRSISQIVEVVGAEFTLWGVPADERHDPLRGHCIGGALGVFHPISFGECQANVSERPFLTLPRACEGPLSTEWEARSWPQPDIWLAGSALTHDDFGNPRGMHGCGKVEFSPRVSAETTSDSAETGSGLDFNLDFEDEGLTNSEGVAGSDVKKAIVTLPEGVTINPSVGEGLGVCTPADIERETLDADPGEGCPNSSKLGSLHVETPLVDEAIGGSIYLAQQDDPATTQAGAENPFDTLIALYFVIENENLGVIVKMPVKVEPDPQTGQLVATLEDSPQLPFSHFNAHLKTGARAALVTPAACGAYTTEAKLTPWANPASPVTTTASFQITRGVGGGPCPSGGVPPFEPGFEAGAINNNAGSHSPFNMRLVRRDGEQNMTKFSAILPPGQVGSLVGVAKCPDAAVEIARAKSGRQELASPSCPASSLIGHTLAGAGVGEALTYVGGQIYLAGAYKGRPLSVISVTPAVAGPFDAGTVVVRLALTLNPKTAEVEVDGAASDPIPHILKGIVLKVRDLRVYVDRPNFLVNPTSCDESSARSTLFGSFLNVLDPADDVPAELSSRYQAANCLNLGFKPKLGLKLKGGTKRGGHPGLTATYRPRKGDANLEGLVVRLPRSAFLDQAHIRTICTRVQFAADACPKAARYGYIKAWTPLLEEPLQGPVWLRSSNHNLPDLVFDLHGLVDVEVATRIDSARGGIRARVEDAPDAALSKVVLKMQGAKKGLIVNSRDLCGAISRASVRFEGHNGRASGAKPVMRARCGKGKRKGAGRKAAGR